MKLCVRNWGPEYQVDVAPPCRDLLLHFGRSGFPRPIVHWLDLWTCRGQPTGFFTKQGLEGTVEFVESFQVS